MNQFVKLSSIIFCFMQVAFGDQITFERVMSPNFSLYESLFFKFGYVFCNNSCDQESLHQVLDYAFYQEALVYANDASQRVFVQAVLLDEVIGYMSCQIMSEQQMYIHHLIIDPDMYHDSLVKDFLFLLLEIMPKLKQISVTVPVFCTELTDLLEYLGFELEGQVSITDEMGLPDAMLYAQYDLKVPSKCFMCSVLYGDNFWNIDEDCVVGMSDPDDDGDDDGMTVCQGMDLYPEEEICPQEPDICPLLEK